MSTKYFFVAPTSCFCRHEIPFLCNINFSLLTWNTFSSNISLFLPAQDYFLCNVKLFVWAQNCFSCDATFLFWTSFRMLCHGDVFLFSRSIKNIITCQKKNKKHHFVTEEKINFVFCASQFFYIFGFYNAHWQHVDILCSGPRNKETFKPSLTHLPVWYTEAVFKGYF